MFFYANPSQAERNGISLRSLRNCPTATGVGDYSLALIVMLQLRFYP